MDTQNGYIYVNYTSEPDDRTVISRFTVSAGDPNVADTAEHVLLEIPQHQRNHNGGMIDFVDREQGACLRISLPIKEAG